MGGTSSLYAISNELSKFTNYRKQKVIVSEIQTKFRQFLIKSKIILCHLISNKSSFTMTKVHQKLAINLLLYSDDKTSKV